MAEPPEPPASSDLRPGQKVSHYEIVSLIGRGGMGSVYRARDVNLGREVALKCPSPEIEQNPTGRQRFLREARAVSALSHPNVVQLFEVFEFEGHPWLAMEFVEGRSLRAALDQRGRLSVLEIVDHAIGLAQALQAAHHKHILHRDVTPRNVLLGGDGRARLTDFGLARGYVAPGEESSASTGLSTLSDSGVIVGTPGYMSPEQALGQPLDPRSDIFSLGLVLYEMCTGKPAFGAAPSGEQLDAILHHEPQPISRYTYDVPDEMERIVRKCIAKRREERYQDAKDLLSDLVALKRGLIPMPKLPTPPIRRWTRWLALGVALGALAVATWYATTPKPECNEDARSYYDRGRGYLSSRPETLESVDSAAQMFRRAIDADSRCAMAWAALGDAALLRFRRWTHDEASRDEAERAVDEALRLQPDLPAALAIKGKVLLEQKDPTAARAILQKAVDGDKNLDDAWANLGRACRDLKDYEHGMAATRKAVELAPQNANYHLYLGRFLQDFSEYEEAAKEFVRAAELDPKSAIAWNNLGAMHLFRGRPEEAIPALERAISIEPRGSALSNLGTAYYQLKRYDKALGSYRHASEVEPSEARHQGNVGDALKMSGRPEEARRAYLEAVRLARREVDKNPRAAKAHLQLAYFCARAGDVTCSLEEAQKAGALPGLRPDDSDAARKHAIIRCLAGRPDEALDWLEKGVKLGLTRAEIENDPDLPSLKSDPRYRRILDLAS